MNILLLGSSGRLGGAFCRKLSGYNLLCPTFQEVDVSNQESVLHYLNLHKPEILINCTAYNKVDLAEDEGKDECFLLNRNIPIQLSKMCFEKNIRFIHFSTDYVFDGEKIDGYNEDDFPNPVNNYGLSKLEGEKGVLENNPSSIIVRVSRLFGPQAKFEGSKSDFVEIVKLHSSQKEVIDFLDSEISCPTFVDDVVSHVEKYLLNSDLNGIFHLSNSGGVSWKTWAIEIVKLLNLNVEVTSRENIQSRKAKIPQNTILLSTKIPQMRSWKEALKEYLQT